jgi:hypothetical protein
MPPAMLGSPISDVVRSRRNPPQAPIVPRVKQQQRRMFDRSTRGSKPFSKSELKTGFRKLK